MSDVDSLKDALEVPNMIQKPAVEHLYHEFEKSQHRSLLLRNAQLAWNFVGGEEEGVLCLDMAESAT